MVFKFRSLKEPNLKIMIHDIDGDEVTVQFEKTSGNLGMFETEETHIAQAMINSSANGKLYMDANYAKRLKVTPSPKVTKQAPKIQATSKKKKAAPKRKTSKK